MTNVSLKKLVETGAHFGHQSRRWNPKMDEYLHGVTDGVHVFDLIKTKVLLEEALAHMAKAHKENKKILILGTKKQIKDMVGEVSREVGVFWVNQRWLGGTFTNNNQIKKSINKLSDMKKKRVSGEYDKRTKKERSLIDREIARLERFFGGISGMQELPEILFAIDVKKEKGAIKEARECGVLTIGIVDSNSDPDSVDMVIPMNDDASGALIYLMELIREALGGKSTTKRIKKTLKPNKAKKNTNTKDIKIAKTRAKKKK